MVLDVGGWRELKIGGRDSLRKSKLMLVKEVERFVVRRRIVRREELLGYEYVCRSITKLDCLEIEKVKGEGWKTEGGWKPLVGTLGGRSNIITGKIYATVFVRPWNFVLLLCCLSHLIPQDRIPLGIHSVIKLNSGITQYVYREVVVLLRTTINSQSCHLMTQVPITLVSTSYLLLLTLASCKLVVDNYSTVYSSRTPIFVSVNVLTRFIDLASRDPFY